MPIVKVRGLNKYGIISDVDPFDLPPEAFSFGQNVRFRQGRVQRGPVFRSTRALNQDQPRFVYGVLNTQGLDDVFIGYQSGQVYLTTPTAETNYSISGYTNSAIEATWTATQLADVVYMNRSDRAPWALLTAGTAFETLPNWPSGMTCQLLRQCGGALVALNIIQSGVAYPTTVQTSTFAAAGAVPVSWDFTQPDTDATQNVLSGMEGPIVDAQPFGASLVIYGHNQAWLMSPSTGFELFDYTKLPFQKGAVNANCTVEVDGKHFVFGPDDIWMHDGVSEQSICEGSNRIFIYSNMNSSRSSQFFVSHNPLLQEISFCYVSADRGVSFPLASLGCNKAAVYNYSNKTWSFDDLPYVFSGSYANLSNVATWGSVVGTWGSIGGSWLDFQDGFKRTPVYVGRADTSTGLASKMYAFDQQGNGSTVSYPVDPIATKGSYLERDGIDLDQLQDMNLSDYKLVRSIYPMASIDANANTDLYFQFGTSDYYGQYPAFFDGPNQFYDGQVNYKLDYNMAGRWISLHITYSDYTTFALSGFDFDVDVTGER